MLVLVGQLQAVLMLQEGAVRCFMLRLGVLHQATSSKVLTISLKWSNFLSGARRLGYCFHVAGKRTVHLLSH
jgi:hypothetical protein